MQAQLVQWLVQPGEPVAAGQVLVILEAMKMEHELRAQAPGVLGLWQFQPGEAVAEGDLLVQLSAAASTARTAVAAAPARAPGHRGLADRRVR